MAINLSGSLGGQIDEMLQGSVAGNISLLNAPAVTEEIEITENGVYTPEEGVDGYSKVIVDVPIPTPTLETLNVTENGTYTPETGVDGFNEVVVDVDVPTPTLETLNVTENGTYTPESGVDGFDEVVVNVPIPINYEIWSNVQSSMFRIYNEGSISFPQSEYGIFSSVWNNNTNVGCTFNGQLNMKDYSKIILDIENIGNSYQRANNYSYTRFNINVGLTDEIYTTFVLVDYNTSGHLLINESIDVKTNYNNGVHKEIDISNITSDCYLFLTLCGINATNISLKLLK